MISLPSPLRSGDPVSTVVPWSQKIIDYLRAITVRPSATVSVATTANGTLLTSAEPAQRSRGSSAILPLNQFKVTAKPYSDLAGNIQQNRWKVEMLGGTAQPMFGQPVSVASMKGDDAWVGDISPGNNLYISLEYNIIKNGNYSHTFEDEADFYVGSSPRQNTESKCYFTIAIVDSDGDVLQGHLGAVFLARPLNAVDVEDPE